MGEIIEGTRRHYVGLDADKDTIPAGGKAFGDSYHANDKGKQYYWNGAAWKTGLGYEYVERRANANDFDGGNPTGAGVDFTTDGNWHLNSLDLTAIVPEGAVAVMLRLGVTDDAAASYFILQADAGASRNSLQITTQVANIGINITEIIAIDNDRLLDYRGANVTFTALNVTVLGWFI